MINIKSIISTIILFILIGISLHDLFFNKKKMQENKKILFKEKQKIIFKENEKILKETENDEDIEKLFEKNADGSLSRTEEKEQEVFIKKLSLNIIKNFNIPKDKYNYIYNILIILYDDTKKINYCDYLFYLFYFSSSNNLSIINILDIGNYIIWNSFNQEHINFIYDKIVEIASNKLYTSNIRSIAVDILIRSNNTKYMNNSRILLERLRNDERKIDDDNNISSIRKNISRLKQQIPVNIIDEDDIELQHVLLNQITNLERRQTNIIQNKKRQTSIYNDSQNVHNHEINESALKSISNLNSINSSTLFNIEDDLKHYYPDYEKNKNIIDISLNKIKTDQTIFKNGMKLSIIFDKIINFIYNSKYKSEMINRLGQELVDMNNLCSTGHMSRLINVIQGFDDIPNELKIKINPKDEIYATINSYLSLEIQKSDNYEELLDDMMIESKQSERLLNFIIDKMKIKVKELNKEYDNIIDKEILKLNIEDALLLYIKNENSVKIIVDKIF